MSMTLGLLLTLSFILVIIILGSIYKNHSVFLLCTMSCGYELLVYTVIAAILYGFDSFSPKKTLAIETTVLIVLAVIVWKKGYRISLIKPDIEKVFSVCILIAICCLFSHKNAQLFCVGQDEGVYQQEALCIIHGDYAIQHEFKEYEILDTEAERIRYLEYIERDLPGFYRCNLSSKITTQYNPVQVLNPYRVKSVTSGVFHGTHVFSALLALFGIIFGVGRMMEVQTIFYICTSIILYYTISGILANRRWSIWVSTLTAVVSPLIIWLSKGAYIETSVILCMVMFLYHIHDSENKASRVLIGIDLLCMSFSHISFIIYFPILFSCCIYLYWEKRDYLYLVSNAIMAIGCAFAYKMESMSAVFYMNANLERLHFIPGINSYNVIWFICICMILSIVFDIFIYLFKKISIINLVNKIFPVAYIAIICGSSIFMLYYGYKIGWLLQPSDGYLASVCHYYGTGLVASGHLSFWALLMATGWIAIPIMTILSIISIIKKNSTECFYTIAIIYCYFVFVVPAFIMKETPYYYYCARYFGIAVPIVAVMAAHLIKVGFKKFMIISLISTIVLEMYFSTTLINNEDDTHITWEAYNTVCQNIEPQSMIIFKSRHELWTLSLPLKYAIDVSVFPKFDDVEKEVDTIKKAGKSIYYVTFEDVKPSGAWIKVASVKNYSSVYINDYQWQFPTRFKVSDGNINIYKYIK